MSRFKLGLAVITFLISTIARAENHLVNLSYWNWSEQFTISKDNVLQGSYANFSAGGLEYEFSSGLNSNGWNVAPAVLLGQATGGDASGDIIYVASYQKFFGAALKATWFWRLEKRIYIEAGGLALYRQLNWPSSGDGIEGSSGATFNYGVTTNLRIRLTRSLDFCQSFGALLVKGSSIWSAGIGYRF